MERLQRQHDASAAPTPFDGLNELLSGFVGRLSSILGAQLVGVYLTGSFALGAGDAASDCDFLAVTAGELGADAERALRGLHEEIPGRPGYWASNLEGSYAPQTDLETLAALGRPWLYVDRGARRLERSPHCNTEDVRWTLANRPLVVAGRDPRTFACDVPESVLQTAMRTQIESFLVDLKSGRRSTSRGRSATRSRASAACCTPSSTAR